MPRLEIHEDLIAYINKLTGKNELNPYVDKDLNIINKINAAYQDCIEFFPESINVFKFITYNIIEPFYNLPKLEDAAIDNYFNKIFSNLELRKKLFNSKPKSEFFSILKDVYPYYLELKKYIDNNQGYMVITTYKDLLDYLDTETLSKKTPEELKVECQKRYNVPYNNVETYQRRMKEKKYKPIKSFEIGQLINKGYYSHTCYLLSKYFHHMMMSYYKNSGFIYSPISDDLSYYQFGKIGILGYRFDDNITCSIGDYKWSRYEFWALLNMVDKQFIKVDDSQIRKIVNYEGELLVAPNDFVEEAIISYLMEESGEKTFTKDFIRILSKTGIPEEYYRSNELKTYDYKTFFINPKNYTSLRIKNIEKIPTLKLILAKSEENREKYIRKIIATYKGQHKEEKEEELTYRERLARNPKAWLD